MGDERMREHGERMVIRPDIEEFVAQVEIYAQRKLNYPTEVGELLHLSVQKGQTDKLEELFFQVKFLVRTQEIMKRIGPSAQEFVKVSNEFQLNFKSAVTCLQDLVRRSEIQEEYERKFLSFETESFGSCMKFFADLSVIKNWLIDGNPLPYQKKADVHEKKQEKQHEGKGSNPFVRIQQSACLGSLFVLLLLCIDPPVTILGWCLSLGIAVFLMYIILQTYLIQRIPKL
jgi:hypothetical protein